MSLPLPFSSLIRFAVAAAMLAASLAGCAASANAPHSAPDRWWPTYGGTFANTRHLDLDQIGPENVGSLALAWKFNTGLHGQLETSPIVVDGTMYFTTGPDDGVYALDAASGALKWHYVPKLGPAPYIFLVNKGVAVDHGRVFLTTLDDRLIALDVRSGKPVWDVSVGDPRQGLREDAAPLAWNGLVFVGSAGNEFGVRGSYSAYSQKDGKLIWRWWAVGPGWEGTFRNSVHGYALHRDIAQERATLPNYRDAWKNGGGAVWMTPALSPEESTVYLSTGNPAPAFVGVQRPGDNLYTDCIVALDAHTGRMKWYYQETPHDRWDYDASSPPILIDALDGSGRRVPAVAEAGKTGWLYVLERRTGRLLRVSAPFVPQPYMYHPFTEQGDDVQPGDLGGAIGPIAYDPQTHSAYVAGDVQLELAQAFKPAPWRPGMQNQWTDGIMAEVDPTHLAAALTAIDVDSGRVRWSTPIPSSVFGGTLSINGLVFLGEENGGNFRAYDAHDGRVLWHTVPGDTTLSRFDARDRATQFVSAADATFHRVMQLVRHQAASQYEDIHAPPIAYRMNGREYVAIASHVFMTNTRAGGETVFAFALP